MTRLEFARRLCFIKLAAPGVVRTLAPSIAAALDAYGASRDQARYVAHLRALREFPALHATQPALAAQAFAPLHPDPPDGRGRHGAGGASHH